MRGQSKLVLIVTAFVMLGALAMATLMLPDAVGQQSPSPDTSRPPDLPPASGEAKADPFSLLVIGLVAVWIVFGLIQAFFGRKTDIWFWPLSFMTRDHPAETSDRGQGGAIGGGGASGRW